MNQALLPAPPPIKTEDITSLLCDFDGNMFNTFPSLKPKGLFSVSPILGVLKAYRISIKEIFGKSALKFYERSGSLGNRAPAEIVFGFLSVDDARFQQKLFSCARTFFDARAHALKDLIPSIPLEWKEPKIFSWKNEAEKELYVEKYLPLLTELLVRRKLELLLPNIGRLLPDGKRWPSPYPGVAEFMNLVQKIPGAGVCVVSSGHEPFIRKSLEANNMECPVIASDDDMRAWNTKVVKFHKRCKPEPHLAIHAIIKLVKHYQGESANFDLPLLKKKAVIIGDGHVDREMAKNLDIDFYHFISGNGLAPAKINGYNPFSHWDELTDGVKRKGIHFFSKPRPEVELKPNMDLG